MSAEAEFHRAMIAAIRHAPGLALGGVFEGPAPKATPPYAEIGELLSTDWSTKDRIGRELRSLIQLRERAETAVPVHTRAAAIDTAIRAIDPALTGWRIASLVLVRSRIVRGGVGEWTALIEHRARLLAD